MPIPDHAFTVTGGCNCGSIRYRVAVPPLGERPPAFLNGDTLPSNPHYVTLPYTASCHCRDCRRAIPTSSMDVLITPAPSVTISALPRSEPESSNPTRAVTGRLLEPPPDSESAVQAADDARPPYLPALDVLRPDMPGSRDTWLRFFHAWACDRDVASRAFCARCGCHVGYHWRPREEWFGGEAFRQPEGFEDVVDILLGTVDAHLLDEGDWLRVERDIWFSQAGDCGREMVKRGRHEGAVRHPSAVLLDRFED